MNISGNKTIKEITAKDLMVTDVVTAFPDDKIGAVDLLMVRAAIGGVPVVNRRNQILGILTQRDIMLSRFTVQISGSKVEDLMTNNPISCSPNDTLDVILFKMLSNNIERLPVIDENNFLLGLIVHKTILEKVYDSIKISRK